ncbi:hypothetical protein MTO96_026063 [Rhipicephalus appendiculatus]
MNIKQHVLFVSRRRRPVDASCAGGGCLDRFTTDRSEQEVRERRDGRDPLRKKRSSSTSSTKSHSSSEQHTSSSEPSTTSGSARGSTSSTTVGSVASSGSFKPLNRPPLPELVLPSDLESSTPRRPSIIYFWDWGNVWFFPASVFVLAFIVVFMVYADVSVRSDKLHGQNETGRRPAQRDKLDYECTRQWDKSVSREQRKTSVTEATKIGGEEEDTADQAADVAASSEANTPPLAWLDGPTIFGRNASRASSLLVATKAVVDDLPQNASTVSGNRG